ncbi:MAG: isocitrate/isopropylmalate family dehydrogenase, partial [Patescibacteria group bacterium]
MNKTIAILPGDGIGPEVVEQGVKVLKAIASKFHHQFIFKFGLIGAEAIEKTGVPLPDNTLSLCRESDAVLFGA